MKLDMDLVRVLLLHIEDPNSNVDLGKYSEEQKSYHRRILQESGLITTTEYHDTRISAGTLIETRLTWQGHDFLDSVRDDSVWNRVKDRMRTAAAWTFGILVEVAKDEVKKRLGFPGA